LARGLRKNSNYFEILYDSDSVSEMIEVVPMACMEKATLHEIYIFLAISRTGVLYISVLL